MKRITLAKTNPRCLLFVLFYFYLFIIWLFNDTLFQYKKTFARRGIDKILLEK